MPLQNQVYQNQLFQQMMAVCVLFVPSELVGHVDQSLDIAQFPWCTFVRGLHIVTQGAWHHHLEGNRIILYGNKISLAKKCNVVVECKYCHEDDSYFEGITLLMQQNLKIIGIDWRLK